VHNLAHFGATHNARKGDIQPIDLKELFTKKYYAGNGRFCGECNIAMPGITGCL
jgi:hypothetical protein